MDDCEDEFGKKIFFSTKHEVTELCAVEEEEGLMVYKHEAQPEANQDDAQAISGPSLM